MQKYKRHLITAALPYANGPLHIGHIAGAYLPADIYVRYLRLKGEDVKFICGSDEHGVPITLRAKKEGITPQQVVDKYHKIIKESFERFGISFDIYHRTSAQLHHQTASDFFKVLYEKKVFTEEESEQFYDEQEKTFLADRYIVGTCPKCGNPNAYGDQCEKCGTSLSPKELINPHSVLSGKPPVLKKTKHWYLPLNKFQKEWLEKWIEGKKGEWKTNVYGQCKSWLTEGLQARAVTRDLDWGVPVPLSDAKGKVLYVWFDAPIGYISATKALTKDWKKYWQDSDTKLVHFIGKDNIVFHCIIFPAMLKAHGEYILPDNVPANEFLNLEGDKISTSRNWAVWLNEYLDEFPDKQDELRYVLCSTLPETKDSEFTWADYQVRVNNELVAIFGNLVNRVWVLTQKNFSGKIPKLGRLEKVDTEILKAVKETPSAVGENLEQFHFREALMQAMNLARAGNKYLADTEPWKIGKENSERLVTILNTGIQIIANLSVVLEPFLPHTAKKIQNALSLKNVSWKDAGGNNLIASGYKLPELRLLFEKIEDEQIKKQIDKLHKGKIKSRFIGTEMETTTNNIPQQKAEINFDEFSKVDIRIGTILEAEKVPNTEKLLKLKVDTGVDTRTVVSGIAEFYQPENIIGKQVCVLVNLAPRKIKGVESQGMILMAEDANGKLVFASPSEKIDNGSIVK